MDRRCVGCGDDHTRSHRRRGCLQRTHGVPDECVESQCAAGAGGRGLQSGGRLRQSSGRVPASGCLVVATGAQARMGMVPAVESACELPVHVRYGWILSIGVMAHRSHRDRVRQQCTIRPRVQHLARRTAGALRDRAGRDPAAGVIRLGHRGLRLPDRPERESLGHRPLRRG